MPWAVVPAAPLTQRGNIVNLRRPNSQIGLGVAVPTASSKLQVNASAGGFAVAGSFLGGSVGLGALAADPALIATQGQIYSKSVLGVLQLFYEASDGTVNQLTPGSATIVTLQDVYDDGNTIAATAARPVAFSNAVDATDLLTLTRTFAGGGNASTVSMGATTTGAGYAASMVAGSTGAAMSFSGGTSLFLESTDGSTSAVSGAATGRLRYNNTTGTWQISTQGGAYSSLSTAATSTLQQAYTNGGAGGGAILLTSAGGALALTNPAASAHAVMTLTQVTAGQNALTASGGNIDLSGGNVLVGSAFGIDTSAAGSLKIGVTTATGIDVGGVGVTALNLTATTTTIAGDLTVNGTVTTINTTNLTVTDSLIYANDGAGSASAGIAWDRQATTNDAIFLWSEANSRFEIGLNDTSGGTVTPASLAIFSDVKLSSLLLAGTAITADAGLTVTATTAPLNLSATGAFAVNLQTSGVTRVEVKSDGPLEFPTNTTAAVSAATKGTLRYNNTTGAFQVSTNGGPYLDIVTGVDTLQASYGAGNTIAATAARPIAFSNAVDATDLLTLTRTFAGAGSASAVSMGAATTGAGYSASMVAGSTGAAMSFSGGTSLFLESTDGSTSAVSGAATGRLRYNNTTGTWQVSTQGGAYSSIATAAAANTLAQVLIAGNGSGANNINMASAQLVQWNADTGISRDSTDGSGFFDFGTGAANSKAGTLQFTAAKLEGKISRYNAVNTTGWGAPAIYGSGRSTGQTAAVASVATYTVGAADGSFDVAANVNVTASTTHSVSVTVSYTDETSTARTLTLTLSDLNGVLMTSVTQVNGTGPYSSQPYRIRCKSGTSITVATTGIFTSVTYNVEATIEQVS